MLRPLLLSGAGRVLWDPDTPIPLPSPLALRISLIRSPELLALRLYGCWD